MLRKLIFAGIALTAMGGVAACDSDDGPMEEAGESIDNAVDETADAVDDAHD